MYWLLSAFVWLLVAALAALLTASAAERLGQPGWIGALLGAVFPVAALPAIFVIVMTPAPDVTASVAENPVLRLLIDHGPGTTHEVAGRLFMTAESTGQRLRTLERAGFVVHDDATWSATAGGRQAGRLPAR